MTNDRFRMGMPSAKKRRLDLEDSFDEDPVIVNKNGSPNDSFDEDVEIEPGPSLVAERILQTQALLQSQRNQQNNQAHNCQSSDVNQPLNRIPSTDAQTFKRTFEQNRAQSPVQSTQSTTSTILTGGHKESGVILMLNKRNENLMRMLEDARREKSSKEIYHLQDKKMIEENYKKQLKNLQAEKEQLQREVLSMSFRQENYLNMTIADGNTTTSASNRTFVPTKPVERSHGPQPNSRLAWMKKSTSAVNTTFKHPGQSKLADNRADLSYVHMESQSMNNSVFLGLNMSHVEKPMVPMVDSECQTDEEDTFQIINVSQREAVIEGLLLTASKMNVEDFNTCNLDDLCRNSQYKPLVREKANLGPSQN